MLALSVVRNLENAAFAAFTEILWGPRKNSRELVTARIVAEC